MSTIQGIICKDGDVRLADGRVRSEGRVEICIRNTWGTICDMNWDADDAAVVCGQLGFSTVGLLFTNMS